MKLKTTLLLLAFIGGICSAQTTYYVDQLIGSADGLGDINSPFQHMDSALSRVSAGDTISIMGTYTNSSYDPGYSYTAPTDAHLWHGENTISINGLHGTEDAYITIKAYDETTILRGDGANIFRVRGCSYLRIEGLTILGEVDSISLELANALQFVYIDADSVVDANAPLADDIRFRDQDCIANCLPDSVLETEVYTDLSDVDVARPSYIDTRGMYLSDVHHIQIIDNHISKMPGGGLRVSECEDIDIIGNEVNDCSSRSYSGTHGLVVTKASSTRDSDDYRIRITQNRVHHNYNEQYSWSPQKTKITPHIDEGKGISLQRNESTQTIDWSSGRILVANNLCYFNGFSGIHSNDGERIDVVNNTVFLNSYTKSITEGVTTNNGGNIGISAQGGKDVRIVNNISIIDTGLSKSAISSNIHPDSGLVVMNNIIYGMSLSGLSGEINENANVADVQVNAIMEAPLFVNALAFDFRLQSNSPARDAANADLAPETDFFGNIRDETPDIGAVDAPLVVSIQEELFLPSFYPNPVVDVLNIRTVDFTIDDISVTDLLGRDFSSAVACSPGQLNMTTLPSGTYLVRVKDTVRLILKR